MEKRIKLADLTLEEMKEVFTEMGEPPFRAKQVFSWIYKGAISFDQMTNLPESLRDKLKKTAVLHSLEILQMQESRQDGTRKYLFGLEDGNTIETVFMRYRYGNSVCISSQAGCKMGCRFCASAIGGLERNLTAGELAGQILEVQRDTGEPVNHIVVMGTGEPFDNYENLISFLSSVHRKEGLNLSLRNITVSTCGLVPEIRRFMKDRKQVNLAVSLHSADDATRESMMPINGRYPVKELLQACGDYTKETGRRITFEYALVKGKTDTPQQIRLLARKLKGMLCHVNLIPLNEVKETGYSGSERKQATEIAEFLKKHGIPATVRRELGADIEAACGQLRLGESEAMKKKL